MELNLKAFEEEQRARAAMYPPGSMVEICSEDHKDGRFVPWEELQKEGIEFQDKAIKEAWAEKDILALLCNLGNTYHLSFVCDNMPALKKHGLFEKALLHSYSITRTNFAGWSLYVLRYLFNSADRARLLSEGDPLPGDPPFTIYRGVSGKGAARRLRGISWTASFEKAKWFAERFKDLGLASPAVMQATINLEHVYAYDNGRNEQEFLCYIPHEMKLKRVWP